ncbi:MAG: tetratricopeptide repeat protein [Ignavibacteria bacterium]
MLRSQNIPAEYATAINTFNQENYSAAYEHFTEFLNYYGIDDELSSTAKYYVAECLLRLNQKDAAISAFNFFTRRYVLSSFRNEALYKLGALYFDNKEYENARQKFRILVNDYPASEYAGSSLYLIGDSYVKDNKPDEAVNFFKNAISSKKQNNYVDNSIYSLANIYEKTGDYKTAAAYYDTLLAYYKTSSLAPHAQLRIGLCYFQLKEYDNATLELKDPLISELPVKQLIEARYMLANSHYRLKEYKEAKATFSGILKENPKGELAKHIIYGLAWVNFQQGNYDEAFDNFNLLANPNEDDTLSINSLYWSAEAKRYSGKEKEARQIYDEFIRSYPENHLVPKVKFQMGVVNFNNNKAGQSEEYLFIPAESDDAGIKARAYILLGELKLNRKDYLRAKQYFRNANEFEAQSADQSNRAALGLGVSEYFLNQYDETIKTLSGLATRAPQFENDKVHFFIAESFFAKKDYSKALKEYNLVDNDNKELSPQVIYSKAYLFYNLKNFNDAAYYFADFVKKFPTSGNYKDARLRLADSYYGQKKYNEAGRIYREIFLASNSEINSDYAYYQYAQALYKAGNTNEAVREFSNLQEKFPESKYVSESQYLIGWIYFQKGNFHESIKNYQKLIAKYPSAGIVPVTLNSIGNAFFNLGRYDSSIAYYNKVISEFPSSNYVFDAISGIKDCYIVSEKPERAVAVIDNYIAKNPKSGFTDQILFKKGEIYYSQRDYEKAKQSYKEFIAAYPESRLDDDAYYWIGKSASNLGQNEEALYNFNLVFNSSLNSEIGISSVLEIGRIHTDLKNYDNAIKVYSIAIDKLPPESPKLAEITFNRAMVYTTKGDMNHGYEDFNYIVQYYSNSVFSSNAKFEVGLIELSRNNFEVCDPLFKELSENRTDELGAKAQYYYGVSLFNQNKTDDAITALVRVKFVFSGFDQWLTSSFLKLGGCYEKKGDKEKAKEMYKTVLTRHKGDNYGVEARNKLKDLE